MNNFVKPSDILISLKAVNPEVMITEVVPRYEYKNDKKTDKVIGKYANGYLLSAVNVDSLGKFSRKEIDVPIKVKMSNDDDSLPLGVMRALGTFSKNFFGKWYWSGKRYALSCWGEKFVASTTLRKKKEE